MAARPQPASETKQWEECKGDCIEKIKQLKDQLKEIETQTKTVFELNQNSQEALAKVQTLTESLIIVESKLKSSCAFLKDLIVTTKVYQKNTIADKNAEIESTSLSTFQASEKEDNFQDKKKNMSILMIGSSGNGKSATGNSILGTQIFPENFSMSSNDKAQNIKTSCAKIYDIEVNVLDGPSINENNENVDFVKDLFEALKQSLMLCNYSFNAILIILKFGKRFTKQEAETIQIIKGMLGENIIKDYGICIITHGDDFEKQSNFSEDEKSIHFENWCHSQTGQVKSLFNECRFKCVLFDNQTEDSNKRKKQVDKLRSLIDINNIYSEEKFAKSAHKMLKLPIDSFIPFHHQEIDVFIQEQDNNCRNNDYKQLEEIISNVEQRITAIAAIGYNSEITQTLLHKLKMFKMDKQLRLAKLAGRQSMLGSISANSDPKAPEESFIENESQQSKLNHISDRQENHDGRGMNRNSKSAKNSHSKSFEGQGVSVKKSNSESVLGGQEDYCKLQIATPPTAKKQNNHIWDYFLNFFRKKDPLVTTV